MTDIMTKDNFETASDGVTRSPRTACLDSLRPHSVLPSVAALDWERNGWRLSYDGKPAAVVSRDALLISDLPAADIVVVEQAHLRERNIYSVAQVYSEAELKSLPFRHKIKLFPGKLVPKAAKFAGNILADGRPDKTKDAESIGTYTSAHPASLESWKSYVLPDEDPSRKLWDPRDQLRAELKEAMNPLRVAWNNKPTEERYKLPEVVQLCSKINSVWDDIPESVKDQFGIKRSKNGLRIARMPATLTIYLSVFDRDGNLRLNPAGGFIGVRFILDAIGMSHSHTPNMARSQLTWHGLRHYKGTRCEYMRNIRHFIQILRDSDSLKMDSVLDSLTDHSVPVSEDA